MTVVDHLTSFLVLVAISDKSAAKIACVLEERIFSVFSAPDTLHSDLGNEFEHELVKELQCIFEFKKRRTSAYRPQGNSMLERAHSTMHDMLAMYVNVKYDNWAELLPFIQLAHNTAYNKTLEETPHFFMFGRRASLPVDIILGVPCTSSSATRLDYSRRTAENLQLAYAIARRNLQERADKQSESNEKLSIPQYQPGDQVLVHRPHTVADGPNPKLISPCRGPFTVRLQLSPVIYRVARDGEPAETSVNLGRIKAYHSDASSSVPDFTALDDSFLGTTLPVPGLDSSVLTVHIGPYTIEAIERHKRGPGKASLANFQYHFLVKYKPSNLGI